jgi:hypothetical protein
MSFINSYEILKHVSDSFNPDIIISMGLGAKRDSIE